MHTRVWRYITHTLTHTLTHTHTHTQYRYMFRPLLWLSARRGITEMDTPRCYKYYVWTDIYCAVRTGFINTIHVNLRVWSVNLSGHMSGDLSKCETSDCLLPNPCHTPTHTFTPIPLTHQHTHSNHSLSLTNTHSNNFLSLTNTHIPTISCLSPTQTFQPLRHSPTHTFTLGVKMLH